METKDIINSGIEYFDQKQYKEALRLFKSALDIDPQDANALEYISMCLYNLGEFKDSIEMLDKLVKLRPLNENYYMMMGDAYTSIDEKDPHEKAEKAFFSAMVVKPRFYEAYEALAQLWQNKNDFDGAFSIYKMALSDIGNNAKIHQDLAVLCVEYAGIGGYRRPDNDLADDAIEYLIETAITHLKKAIKINPRYSNAYNMLGYIYSTNGDFIKAVKYYKKEVELEPDDSPALWSLAQCLEFSDNIKEAIGAWKKYIKLEKNDNRGYNQLANLYEKLEMYSEALEAYKKALSIDPHNSYIVKQHTKCLEEINRKKANNH